MRRFLAFLAVLVLMPAALAMVGCRSKPGLAVGWSSTAALTGARLEAGEYELDNPFGSPDGGSATPAPAQPDPALATALKSLDERQAKAEQRLQGLDAQVASGALTPEQAAEIRKATASSEGAAQTAREAIDKAKALDAKATELEGKLGKAPGIPTDWTPAGLVTAAIAAGGWLLKRSAAKTARREADAAKAQAMAHTSDALQRFDALPEDAKPAEVREAVAPPAIQTVV